MSHKPVWASTKKLHQKPDLKLICKCGGLFTFLELVLNISIDFQNYGRIKKFVKVVPMSAQRRESPCVLRSKSNGEQGAQDHSMAEVHFIVKYYY